MTGPISEATHSRKEVGELMDARLVIGGKHLTIGSHGGDLTVSHPGKKPRGR